MIRSRLFRVGLTCLVLFGSVALGAFALSAQEPGQIPCAERSNMVGTLESQFDEAMRGFGYVSRQAMAELHISETGTWTFIITNPEGVSCVLAAGQYWNMIAPKPKGPVF